jgi:hypothetical protein
MVNLGGALLVGHDESEVWMVWSAGTVEDEDYGEEGG